MLVGKILPFINGETQVSLIAEQSSVDLAIVKMVIQHLVYFKLLQLTDLFQFSNVYSARQRLAELVYTPSRQRKFLTYLKRHVVFEDENADVMANILDNLPLVKLPSFLVALTHCENQAHSVEQFVLAYYAADLDNDSVQQDTAAASHDVSKQHEALLGEVNFVKHLVKYAVLKKYIRKVSKIHVRPTTSPSVSAAAAVSINQDDDKLFFFRGK